MSYLTLPELVKVLESHVADCRLSDRSQTSAADLQAA